MVYTRAHRPETRKKNPMKKHLLLIPATVATFVAFASPASAHTATVAAKCDTLTVDLKWYEPGSTATVTIDGKATVVKFDDDWSGEFTGTKSWTVKVDNSGEGYDSTESGVFTDCTPLAPELPVTSGGYSFDCATQTAVVRFVNDGNVPDRLSVGGTPVDVPSKGSAQVTLTNLAGTTAILGPVSSSVTNTSVPVSFGSATVNSLGDVTAVCLDTTVLERVVLPPTELAFTGAQSTILGSIAAALLVFGFGCMVAVRRISKP